jgi:gamma-glutamylcyclotransferase (GGCT)/AIG2-like uncharacterized protein YtfP
MEQRLGNETEDERDRKCLHGLPPTPPPLPVLANASGITPPPRSMASDITSRSSKRSAMAAKFGVASKVSSVPSVGQSMFRPCYFFFYGSLMDPEVLWAISKAPEEPKTEKAWIVGFKIKMWGIYPALVPSPDRRVAGICWKLEDLSQLLNLQRYETDRYTPRPCTIYTESGDTVYDGQTFFWAGDPESQELEDGTFDFERYKKYFKPSVVKKSDSLGQ